MNYDVDYFIDKFEKIPEEMWCTGTLTNRRGQHCSLGHCGAIEQDKFIYMHTVESNCLVVVLDGSPISINDGFHPHYRQPTPKQRILAALRDIKAKQSPPVEQPTKQEPKTVGIQVVPLQGHCHDLKERTVYVTVDEKVRELQKVELPLQ